MKTYRIYFSNGNITVVRAESFKDAESVAYKPGRDIIRIEDKRYCPKMVELQEGEE